MHGPFLFERSRPAEEDPLGRIAAERTHLVQLADRLHALGDHAA